MNLTSFAFRSIEVIVALAVLQHGSLKMDPIEGLFDERGFTISEDVIQPKRLDDHVIPVLVVDDPPAIINVPHRDACPPPPTVKQDGAHVGTLLLMPAGKAKQND